MQIQIQTPIHPKYRWDASYDTPYPTKDGRHCNGVPVREFYNTNTQSFTDSYHALKAVLSGLWTRLSVQKY